MKYYTLAEVAKILRVHPNTVHRMINSGRLLAARIDRVYRIPESAIEALTHKV